MKEYRILIADDEQNVIDDLKKVIGDDHSVYTASCINDEEKLIKEKAFDLVIQDIRMPKDLGGLDLPIEGFKIIKKYLDEGHISFNNPVVYYMSNEKEYNLEVAKDYGVPAGRLHIKTGEKTFFEGLMNIAYEELDNPDIQSLSNARRLYPRVIETVEKLAVTMELQNKIIEMINTYDDVEYLQIDQFVNGYRRVYKLIIKKLLEKYPASSAHYNHNNLNRWKYLNALLESSIASLYASLIQATNGAEHRESEQESQDEFGFIFDDENVGQIDDDKFADYYDKDVFRTLCLGLFAFIETAGKFLENTNKIKQWNDSFSNKVEKIRVIITGIMEFGAFAKTETGEDGLIHIRHFGGSKIEDKVKIGQTIQVENRGMSSNKKGLDFRLITEYEEKTGNVDDSV